jgi:hypothetical protein
MNPEPKPLNHRDTVAQSRVALSRFLPALFFSASSVPRWLDPPVSARLSSHEQSNPCRYPQGPFRSQAQRDPAGLRAEAAGRIVHFRRPRRHVGTQRPLWDDPRREEWFGGATNFTGVHSICVDLLGVDEIGERLAFGSTTGSFWASENGGDLWETVSVSLATIHVVRFEKLLA